MKNQPSKRNTFRLLYLLLMIPVLLLWSCTSEPPRKIEILFLGHDSRHHDSEQYLPLLAAALTPKGINFTYTSDPHDLNEENLKNYDGLALYANHDSITAGQEKALLQFVKNGKGFIPIHCASFCFRNSEPFVQLVGAQFKEHETGTFTADIIRRDHPVTESLNEFETWDETYVHHLHNEDRMVLMERVEGDRREPWTWVRHYGKGRIFYTAYGHDERTWDNPGFHALMERGILWAVGDELSENLQQLEFPKREYSEAKLPNYEKRDPPPRLQTPLSPQASQKLIQVPPGFELQLFAAEPDIGAPVSANWDEKGRLWLLETEDYPNEIHIEDGIGNDRIKIIEDTDGDGKADKFTIFADNLSVPTSLVFHNGAGIVAQAPHFLYLKDTDGDDRADIREIIMSGWGTFDTHAGPSNLKYGFDNWIWGTVGYSAFKGKVGPDSLEFRQGVYRFKPDGSAMEYMGATTNNTWGLGFSETFDIFVSTANNTHSAYLAIPDRYTEGISGITDPAVKKIEGHYAFHPVTKNVRQVDVFGGFTAAAGHNLYTARDFPKEYWNRIAFVCEPTGHLLHKAILERKGAGFREKDGWNMLASVDEWVSPVHAEVGPDGALWILDWYNFIIQHNPTPEGFETGPGNAHINPFRDKQHGRIYRLVYKDARSNAPPQLHMENPEKLVRQLQNDNMFWRLHAQRLLVERGKKDIFNDLFAIVEDQTTDEIGLNSPAVHALWTLHGLSAFGGSHRKALQVARNALNHHAAGVRKAALQVLPKSEETSQALITANSLFDADPNARMEALLALSQMPTADTIGTLLFQLNKEDAIQKDEWLAKALYIANVRHKNSLMKAIQREEPSLLIAQERSTEDWSAAELDDSDWQGVPVPQSFQRTGIEDLNRFDGIVWYRRSIDLTPAEVVQPATLHLGKIDDGDHTYINGKKVGALADQWDEPRIYPIESKVLRAGKNHIAVRVEDKSGRGGILGEPEAIFLQIGNTHKPLAGTWKFKIEEIYRRQKPQFSDGVSPLSLFLQNYGPEAQQLAEQFATQDQLEPADQVITIKTIPEQMRYDIETFTATAGTTIEIVFENNDAMQHNMLIIEPGSLEPVGKAADGLALSPQGPKKGYVPDLSYVLAATSLLNPDQTTSLRFDVPDVAGEYPFVCTFPGHWRTMNGIMKVVSKNL